MELASATIRMWTLIMLCMVRYVDAVVETQRWHLDRQITNYTTGTDLLEVVVNVSRLKCAARCSRLQQCLSFFYTKNTGTCRLHSNRFTKGGPKKDVTPSPGTNFYSDRCNAANRFRFYKETGTYFKLQHHEKASRAEALAVCETLGARLARVKTPTEPTFIKGLYENAVSKGLSTITDTGKRAPLVGLWLDAAYNNITEEFTWSDGVGIKFVDSFWQNGMPDPKADAYCVVMLLPPTFNYTMETLNCDNQHGVKIYPLCECVP